MKYWYFIITYCFLSTLLIGQSEETVLDRLQAGETLEIDWVQQQYLPDSGSVVGDYPLFPDQLKEGEGEMHTRLRLQLTTEQQLEIRVISVFCLKSAFTYPSNLKDIEKDGNAKRVAFLPTIEDTRYYFDNDRPMPKIYKELEDRPILYDFDNGIMNENWFSEIHKVTEVMPSFLNVSHLENFLSKVLSAEWLSKEYYQLVTIKKVSDSVAAHFFRPKLPPKKTIIQGVIHNFHEPKISLSNHKEGSLIRVYDRQEDFALDSLGQFKIELTYDRPLLFQLHHVFYQFQVYVEPGDSLNISMNANAFFRDVKFSGDNAVSNEVLMEVLHGLDQKLTGVDYAERNSLTQAEYIETFHNRQAYTLRFIERNKKNISTEFYQFLNRHILIRNVISATASSGTFYNTDGYLTPEFQNYCQKLNRLFFRLPTGSPNYFWALENYTSIYYYYILMGAYQNLEINTPLDFRFTLGSMLCVAPENIFKLSEISLFSSGNIYNHNNGTLKLYQALEAGCTLKESKELLADYRDATNSFPQIKFFRYLMRGQNAPNWRFLLEKGNRVELNDYKDELLLLHIGLEKNLAAAKANIATIKKKTNSDFKSLSIISKANIENNKYENDVLYIKPLEMKMLRDSYLITTNANMFFIIGPDGKIKNSLFDTDSHKDLTQMVAKFTSPKERWQPTPIFWQNLGISALALLFLGGIYTQRKRTLAKREQQKRQLVELELKGIRAQMNPHFLFNALSSIQNLIRKKEDIAADRYLTQFAGLVRKILRNSEQEFITLEEEMAAIKQYCSLEALRTPFEYDINIADDIDDFNTYIPGMLLQPIIENAILHGLMPQKGAKKLWINIQNHPQGLACEVIDNGIGINQAKQQQQRHKAHQKSFGMALIRQRIQLLVGAEGGDFLKIQDRSELIPPAIGTIVNLIIPIEK